MSPRALGFYFSWFAVFAAIFRWLSLRVPVFKIPFLSSPWFGWLCLAVLLAIGVYLIWRGEKQWKFSPLTWKQIYRFRAIKRGYVSFLLLLSLIGIAALDNLIVGKKALLVSYQGTLHVPFVRDVIPGRTFGLDYDAETDYRALQQQFREDGNGNWVLMPLAPYAAKLDTSEVIETLEMVDGKVYRQGKEKLFNGRAFTVFKDKPSKKRQEWVYRYGLKSGEMRGWNMAGDQIEKARYENGQQVSYTDFTDGKAKELEAEAAPALKATLYPPLAPSWTHRHFMGTNSSGGDVLAILFGGWQQAIIAAALYLTVVFGVGILIGGTLGYFGGLYDLIGQRVIEVWSNLPFLFIVMIVSSVISPTLVLLVGIIAIFGWMGTTTYLRTAAYKEKARDYVASAKLLGASTGRIIFHHILPNSIAILVTLAPFEVAGIITALASLDFLGFGLPPEEPSWGRLLREGTENFNYPWIVSSAFVAMVLVLVLVTFVGEAIREAFDPKKFTIYE